MGRFSHAVVCGEFQKLTVAEASLCEAGLPFILRKPRLDVVLSAGAELPGHPPMAFDEVPVRR